MSPQYVRVICLTHGDGARGWGVGRRGRGSVKQNTRGGEGASVLHSRVAHSSCLLFFRVLSTYIIWRSIKDQVPLLSKEFRGVHDMFKRKLLGSKTNKTREATCFSYTNNVLGPMLGALFIRNAFSAESKRKVLWMPSPQG